MFDVGHADVTGNAELAEALARSRRSMVAYVAPLIEAGVLRGEPQALGQMMWAAAHGLVMLRLAGIVADDAELRKLHEQTMSALVRGTWQDDTRPRAATKPVSPARPRKTARQTARSPPRKS
jgi:hypothetical protein